VGGCEGLTPKNPGLSSEDRVFYFSKAKAYIGRLGYYEKSSGNRDEWMESEGFFPSFSNHTFSLSHCHLSFTT